MPGIIKTNILYLYRQLSSEIYRSLGNSNKSGPNFVYRLYTNNGYYNRAYKQM